jgi:hypothetical protein
MEIIRYVSKENIERLKNFEIDYKTLLGLSYANIYHEPDTSGSTYYYPPDSYIEHNIPIKIIIPDKLGDDNND